MNKIQVNTAETPYSIYIANDFFNLTECLKPINTAEKLLIVTDNNVKKLYADEISELLKKDGYDTSIYSFSPGEKSKNFNTVLSICEACLKHGMDRKSMIVSVGGGVVGDVAGFAAAIFMRGIDYIQLPTTLLSQTDSSIGGKTGVDFMNAKNIIGAFHQPRLVYININVLKTLNKRELISGMGEIIKHAIIKDEKLFSDIENNANSIMTGDNTFLADMIYRNCIIKSEVVERDEYEKGERAILNFGHTIGHAIESYYDGNLTHGECVGIGMLSAAYISLKRQLLNQIDFSRINEILNTFGFKTKIEIDNTEKLKMLMQKDKKKSNGRLNFILPSQIGSVTQCLDVTEGELDAALSFIRK